MKPPMGILIIRSNSNKKCLIEATQNLKGRLNSTSFKLNAGGHPNQELQKEWKELGEANFTIKILENLEYDKEDDTKTDYSEDLALLKLLWQEKLTKEGFTFYSIMLR